MVLLIFVAFILLCMGIDAIVQFRRHKKAVVREVAYTFPNFFSENTIILPKGLYFDKTHTWAFMEKNGNVKVGIDDFILHITGYLSHVKMKNPGEKIQKGEPAFTIIQNGKQLTINAPISGIVKSQNNLLAEDCSLVNSSPYNDGWVYMVEPSNWFKDTQLLIMADKYKEWLKNEFLRLKDFLAGTNLTRNAEFLPIMLQDGGEYKDNVLENFGPEVWEEFQVKFINASKLDFGKTDSTFTIINI